MRLVREGAGEGVDWKGEGGVGGRDAGAMAPAAQLGITGGALGTATSAVYTAETCPAPSALHCPASFPSFPSLSTPSSLSCAAPATPRADRCESQIALTWLALWYVLRR